MNDQSITFGSQRLVYTDQGFGGWTLQEGAGLFVDWPAKKVLLRRVAMSSLMVESSLADFHEIGLAKRTGLPWWSLLLAYANEHARRKNSDKSRWRAFIIERFF